MISYPFCSSHMAVQHVMQHPTFRTPPSRKLIAYPGNLNCFLLHCGKPSRACTARAWSVCLSVTKFSATTHNKPAKKRHQRVQRYTGFMFKMAIFVKLLCSKVMAWKPSEQANMLISTGLPRPGPLALCILSAFHSFKIYFLLSCIRLVFQRQLISSVL